MKKLFLVLGLLLAGLHGWSQENDDDDKKKKKTDLLFSIFGGCNFSGINGGSESYDGLLCGAHLGVGTNVMDLSDVLRVRAEAIFSMQGSKYKMQDDIYDNSYGSGKVRTNYINIPITARYQTPGGFFAEAGIQPGFLISAKDKYKNGSANYKDQLKTFDLGLPFGVGYEFKNHIGVGLRIVPGLTNINKKTSTYSEARDRNFVGTVRASYSF